MQDAYTKSIRLTFVGNNATLSGQKILKYQTYGKNSALYETIEKYLRHALH